MYGTSPAKYTIEARRGFDLILPFSLRDDTGALYDNLEDWTVSARFASEQGAGPFFILTSAAASSNGSRIVLDEEAGTIELTLKAADQAGFALTAGPSPDTFYFEIQATGPGFGSWPLVAGPFVLGKSS